MSFRDTEQQAAVCDRLVKVVHHKGIRWSAEGPSPAAFDVLEGKVGLSHGERVIVLVAHAVWSGEGGLSLGEMLQVLDGPRLVLLGELFLALSVGSSRAVDAWLERNGGAHG